MSFPILSPNIRRVWEINSDVEFRLAELCEYHKRRKKLEANSNHGLNGYHEYLTNDASLDLSSVTTNLERLQCLQTILKYAAHGRAHDRRMVEGINGIDFDGRRIVIQDCFVQESREQAEIYLDAVKRA